MSTPFLGEIRIFSFNFPPKGWAQCNGQLLPINQNQALFALLGTFYGGNGQTTFALPDFRGRAPIHQGQGYTIGQNGGEYSHTLNMAEMPQHTHLAAAAASANLASPAGNLPGKGTSQPFYATQPNTTLNATSVTNTGGSQPHANIQPYLALNICIALQGIFPSQN
jgi:microcystin-dependent protein